MSPGTRPASGFSLLELAVSISIIGVLAAVLLNRLIHYQELAEKAAMESTARMIKTGLQIRLAELIIANREGEAAMLESEDPMRWLDVRPANYGGPYREPPAAGAWYFDERARQLVYVVNTGNRLEIDGGAARKEIRFGVRLTKARVQVTGGTTQALTGVTFAPVRSYRWP